MMETLKIKYSIRDLNDKIKALEQRAKQENRQMTDQEYQEAESLLIQIDEKKMELNKHLADTRAELENKVDPPIREHRPGLPPPEEVKEKNILQEFIDITFRLKKEIPELNNRKYGKYFEKIIGIIAYHS